MENTPTEIELLEKAAEQGDAMAQLDIAFCYNNGKGVEQCYSKAAYWYEKAAEQGLPKAQHNLGFSYYNGEGVKQWVVSKSRWARSTPISI